MQSTMRIRKDRRRITGNSTQKLEKIKTDTKHNIYQNLKVVKWESADNNVIINQQIVKLLKMAVSK